MAAQSSMFPDRSGFVRVRREKKHENWMENNMLVEESNRLGYLLNIEMAIFMYADSKISHLSEDLQETSWRTRTH